MVLEAYSPCPCGSGKKFKWCCQPIHQDIDKAFALEANGQHEMALKTIDDAVAQHPSNPEAWGRKAELLYRNGKPDEAEAALQKAFDLNPNYPYGLLLQGTFRLNEGETTGALLLFRRAVDAYDPDAREALAQLQSVIAETELKMNRPVAMHAALKLANRLVPGAQELQQALEGYFGENSPLPTTARRDYTFQSPANLPAARKAAWDQALEKAATGKLTDAAKAFWEQTEADNSNAAAWYNLALARIWLGDNRGGIDALDRYVTLETDETKAAEAWALAEVLRQGHGMGDVADVIEYSIMYQIRDPKPIQLILQNWQDQRRMIVIRAGENEPLVSLLILEKVTSLTADPTTAPPPHLAAYFVLINDRVRIWHTNRESLDKVRDELRQGGPSLVESPMAQAPANFNDILAEALVFPVNAPDKAFAEERVRQQMARYFEEVWLHRPLKTLNGVPPLDAAGHGTLRKKVRGVVQFLSDVAERSGQPYDFDRLRRKLGLIADAPAPAAATGTDVTTYGAAELAALQPDQLSVEQLEQAFQAAMKLDARELAGRFGKALIGQPTPAGRDRYPVFNHLVASALAAGDSDAALNFLNEGEKADCEQNEGKRRNDYELRRGQIHAKRGEAETAQDVFDRLIARVPSELKFRSSAAEAMLSAGQGAAALSFAEGGVAKAREQNNRDLEGHFMELAEAARRKR